MKKLFLTLVLAIGLISCEKEEIKQNNSTSEKRTERILVIEIDSLSQKNDYVLVNGNVVYNASDSAFVSNTIELSVNVNDVVNYIGFAEWNGFDSTYWNGYSIYLNNQLIKQNGCYCEENSYYFIVE